MNPKLPDPSLDIQIEHGQTETRLVVIGDIDIATVGQLRNVVDGVRQAGHDRIVADLSRVTFCDSSGLGTIVELHEELSGQGGRLELCGLGAALLKIVEITGLDRSLHITR